MKKPVNQAEAVILFAALGVWIALITITSMLAG